MNNVLSVWEWKNNGEMVADVARLGYLRREWRTLDCTYGYGTFWNLWEPAELVCTDINPRFSEGARSVDFRHLPFRDHYFDCVVLDGPYKLNGTPDPEVDERYGTHIPTRWQDRMQLIRDGITECARVLGDGYLLVKCKDQVCSGKKRWQTISFTRHAERQGLGLVDRLLFVDYRPQPPDRSQVHAWENASALLIFKRGHKWEDGGGPVE